MVFSMALQIEFIDLKNVPIGQKKGGEIL